MTLAEQVVNAAIAKGLTITVAESCTGGMICAALTDVAGSSAMFERGFITYSNAAKADMIGVEPATLDAHGAVSEQVAEEMAKGSARLANANIAIAVTGIAGPGGSDHKPEGRVCFGLCVHGTTVTVTQEFGALGRAKVRQASVDTALTMLNTAIDSL